MNSVLFLSNVRTALVISNAHNTIRQYAVIKATSTGGSIMGLGKSKKAGKMGKLGAVVEKVVHPVEADTEKLLSYVCGSNIHITGEDVKLKPDGEYPEWLWSLRTEGPPRLEDMDPSTKQYWLRVRAEGMRRNNKLRKLKKF